MKREIAIGDETFVLYRPKNARSVGEVRLWSERFKASVSQLETLSKKVCGMTNEEIATEEGITEKSVSDRVYHLIRTNGNLTQGSQTIGPIIEKANHLELIFPMSIIGLKAIAEELG